MTDSRDIPWHGRFGRKRGVHARKMRVREVCGHLSRATLSRFGGNCTGLRPELPMRTVLDRLPIPTGRARGVRALQHLRRRVGSTTEHGVRRSPAATGLGRLDVSHRHGIVSCWDSGHASRSRLRGQVLDPLLLMHRSLVESGQKDLATGSLLDLIRRVQCFGIALAPLDLRQVTPRAALSLVEAPRRELQGLGSIRHCSCRVERVLAS